VSVAGPVSVVVAGAVVFAIRRPLAAYVRSVQGPDYPFSERAAALFIGLLALALVAGGLYVLIFQT
jgi:hypothetical protein